MECLTVRTGYKLMWAGLLSWLLIFGGYLTRAHAHCAGNHTGSHPHCSGGEPPASAMKQEIVTVQPAAKQREQIVIMNADGTDVQVVLVSERFARFFGVSWSGDGSKILFRGEINGQAGIYWIKVFNLDGTGNRTGFAPGQPVFVSSTLTADPHARWSPKKAPDGKEWIAYYDTTDPEWQMWLVNPYSPSEKVPLASPNGWHEYQPSWSPAADRIVFLSYPSDGSCLCPGDIQILELGKDASGKIEVQNRVSLIVENPYLNDGPGTLKNYLASQHFFEVDWANKGEWIIPRISPVSGLWAFPADPTQVEPKAKDITNDPELSYLRAVWSPSDNALLFTRDGFGGVCAVPDNNDDPALQGGPSSVVMAPLVTDSQGEIVKLDICKATAKLSWLTRYSYGWWRGGSGVLPPFAP